MYYDPDLTGQDEGCLVDNDIYIIHKAMQRIVFNEPIYLNGIEIVEIATINNNTQLQPLTEDIDWIIADDDYADTEIARMKAYDSTFSLTLINAITIQRTFISEYRINIKHQRLYPIDIKKSLLVGRRIDVTPDMIGNMLEQINYLTTITSSVSDISSITENAPRLYDVDNDMSNDANIVEEEIHTVNVLTGKKVIAPVAGPFYKTGVTVSIVDNPDPMVLNTDYIIFGLDAARTRATSAECGVYTFIMILKEYVGEIEISYHAYGGNATVYDISAVNRKINSVISYLQEASFMTSDGLGNAPIIVALNEKITALEVEMRKLYENYPSYGDVTSGSSAFKKLVCTDADLHWYSIATLFKFDGSDEIVTADRMFFRLSTLNLKFMFDVMVNVNINNTNDPFTVTVLSENYPKGFVPFTDYSNIADIVRPQLRIIYNNNAHQNSGIILQLGLELKTLNEESVVIEDLSGKESCWKLIATSEDDVTPDDNVVTLPSGDHIYDELNSDSVSYTTLVPFKDGYICWAGSESLNRPTGGFKDFTLTHLLPANIDIKRFTKCRIELQEVDGVLFPVEIPFIPGSENMTGTANFIYNGDVAIITINIRKELDSITNEDAIFMDMVSTVDSSTSAAELQFKHLFVFTN